MTLKKNPLVFASLVSLAFAPFAAADFEKYLPNGETYALLKVENADALRKHFDENAFARDFKSKVFAPMGSAFRAIDEEGYDEWMRELSAFPTDFFSVRGEFVAAALAGDEVPAVVLIADCGANFTLGHAEENARDALKSVEEKFVIKNAKVLGVPAKKIILSDEKFQFVIAVVDGKLVSASTVPALEKIVRAMKSGNASGLSASAAFRKARARIGSANLWFYADGKSIADAIYDYAEKMDKETAEKLAENPESAMFSIMAKPVVKAFAPEAIDSIWASYSTDMFGNPVSETAFAWNEKRGLVAMIADSVRDGFEKPNYPLPAHFKLFCRSFGFAPFGNCSPRLAAFRARRYADSKSESYERHRRFRDSLRSRLRNVDLHGARGNGLATAFCAEHRRRCARGRCG